MTETVKTMNFYVESAQERNYVSNYEPVPQQGHSPTQSDDKINNYCPHCVLNFENQQEWEHHNVEMHGQKRVLTCSICTATFRRQDHLKRHLQSLHPNQKFCTCPVCGHDYKRQDLLLKHIKTRHTIGPHIFHCRECNFQCPTLPELEKHELQHLATDRHVCPHCSTSFKRRDHMLRHVKSQHFHQTVGCPVCSQTFKRKDHLVRHVREKHKLGFLNGKLVKSTDFVSKN